MTGGFDKQTGKKYPGVKDAISRKAAMTFKAELLEKRAFEVTNFIAANTMRTSATVLRKEAGQ